MTIREAINRVDGLKHNVYSENEKIAWLSKVDSMVKSLIIDTHEYGGYVYFDGYDQDTDLNTELLVPAPFDGMYLRWLEAQIDYHNGENAGYNSAIILFNSEFNSYAQHYNRNNMPLNKGNRFVF